MNKAVSDKSSNIVAIKTYNVLSNDLKNITWKTIALKRKLKNYLMNN